MLQTSMNFLSRDDLYQTEKPYLCLFETPEDFPKSNIRLSKCKDLKIEDIRCCNSAVSLDTHGFAIMPLKSKLSYDDFGDAVKVKGQYLHEVAEQLRCFTGASRVQIFEHLACIYHSLISWFRYLQLHWSIGSKAPRDIPNFDWWALSVQSADIYCTHRSLISSLILMRRRTNCLQIRQMSGP